MASDADRTSLNSVERFSSHDTSGTRVSKSGDNDFQLTIPICGTSTTAFRSQQHGDHGSISEITYYLHRVGALKLARRPGCWAGRTALAR